jgi:hypothetical protein
LFSAALSSSRKSSKLSDRILNYLNATVLKPALMCPIIKTIKIRGIVFCSKSERAKLETMVQNLVMECSRDGNQCWMPPKWESD